MFSSKKIKKDRVVAERLTKGRNLSRKRRRAKRAIIKDFFQAHLQNLPYKRNFHYLDEARKFFGNYLKIGSNVINVTDSQGKKHEFQIDVKYVHPNIPGMHDVIVQLIRKH